MKKIVFFLILTAGLLFSSCVTTASKNKKTYSVFMTDTKKVNLLPPSCTEKNINVMQMFTGSFFSKDSKSVNMIACTESTEKKISIVMLNELGIEMVSVLYSDEELSLKSSFLPDTVRPEYIIMDIQNIYYKSELLSGLYKDSGLSFSVKKDNNIETRLVMDGNTIIENIEKKDGEIILHNYLRGYTYRLTEIADE
ncbi:MAG: DUF3261 domain-containing protein [Treponema sp.]|nr:DUF3261 domain-containing protein [Treponema sp.]